MKLKNGGLGTLKENSDLLWKVMLDEIKRHGYSDNTLNMEGTVRAIYEIIELNDLED